MVTIQLIYWRESYNSLIVTIAARWIWRRTRLQTGSITWSVINIIKIVKEINHLRRLVQFRCLKIALPIATLTNDLKCHYIENTVDKVPLSRRRRVQDLQPSAPNCSYQIITSPSDVDLINQLSAVSVYQTSLHYLRKQGVRVQLKGVVSNLQVHWFFRGVFTALRSSRELLSRSKKNFEMF